MTDEQPATGRGLVLRRRGCQSARARSSTIAAARCGSPRQAAGASTWTRAPTRVTACTSPMPGRNGRLDIDELAGRGRLVVAQGRAPRRADHALRHALGRARLTITPADAVAPTRAVLSALLAGKNYPDGAVGRMAVEVLTAAYLSHEQGGAHRLSSARPICRATACSPGHEAIERSTRHRPDRLGPEPQPGRCARACAVPTRSRSTARGWPGRIGDLRRRYHACLDPLIDGDHRPGTAAGRRSTSVARNSSSIGDAARFGISAGERVTLERRSLPAPASPRPRRRCTDFGNVGAVSLQVLRAARLSQGSDGRRRRRPTGADPESRATSITSATTMRAGASRSPRPIACRYTGRLAACGGGMPAPRHRGAQCVARHCAHLLRHFGWAKA